MESPPEPFLAWPAPAELRRSLGLSFLFCLLFLLVYGGADLITGLHGRRVRVHMDWELGIPFIAPMAGVYLSLNLMLFPAPWILRERESFSRLFRALSVELLAAGACFILLPAELAFAPPLVEGAWRPVFLIADAVNLTHNMLPSLHVAFAVTGAALLGERCGAPGKAVYWIWAAAIALSTVLTRQHYVLDVLAGSLLAWGTLRSQRKSEADFVSMRS